MELPIEAQDHTKMEFITMVMNEVKTHFTSNTKLLKKNGYFMVMLLWHMYEWLCT